MGHTIFDNNLSSLLCVPFCCFHKELLRTIINISYPFLHFLTLYDGKIYFIMNCFGGSLMGVIICSQCGAEIDKDSKFCNECGKQIIKSNQIDDEVVNESAITLEKDEEIEKEMTHNKNAKILKKPVLIILGFILIIGITITSIIVKTNIDERNRKNRIKAEKLYAADFNKCLVLIKLGEIVSQSKCASIAQAWQDAIDDDEDFNDAIQDELDRYKSSKPYQKQISKAFSKIDSPKTKFNSAYEALIDLYGKYKKILQKADSPSGSLLTYGMDVNRLVSDFTEQYAKVTQKIPTKYRSSKIDDSMDKIDKILN